MTENLFVTEQITQVAQQYRAVSARYHSMLMSIGKYRFRYRALSLCYWGYTIMNLFIHIKLKFSFKHTLVQPIIWQNQKKIYIEFFSIINNRFRFHRTSFKIEILFLTHEVLHSIIVHFLKSISRNRYLLLLKKSIYKTTHLLS